MMNTNASTIQHDHRTTLHLSFEAPLLEGDRVAAIVDRARRLTDDTVRLEDIGTQPARVDLVGSTDALERIRSAVQKGDAPELGAGLRSMEIDPASRSPAQQQRLTRVMLVDGDVVRAKKYVEFLGRAEIEVYVLGTVAAARSLLLGSSLPFDAIVVRHRLPDGKGLDLLSSVSIAQRRHCSVLVIDAEPEAARAQDYREHGVHAYVDELDGPLEVIGSVHSTACDTYKWRRAGRRRPVSLASAPSRVYLDPSHAADRLAHVYELAPVEREVAYWVLMGLRDIDIAKRLGRSERTAKRHVGRILEKAEIQNRASLWIALHHEAGGDAPERAREGDGPSASPQEVATSVANGPSPGGPSPSGVWRSPAAGPAQSPHSGYPVSPR